MYETFEHTADVGLRIRAEDLPTLFAEAGRGLFSLIVENLDAVRPVEEVTFEVTGAETDYLLFDWLNELLYRFDAQQLVGCEFDVRQVEGGIRARVRGERLDRQRHGAAYEVKAITYHGLKAERTADGWEGEVIVDI